MSGSAANEQEAVYQEFMELVNMTPKQLQKWLQTDKSRDVGFKQQEGAESVGHQSGGKIITILQKKKADLEEVDYTHMRKVLSYIKRHSAQKPSGDIEHTNWRFSLMNWGHDPMKD